ncbi:Odorant receptor 131-2 [Merluccius polli]|uniref:Odorant receptor 131-2 n=1 Tax=Merluccius polli TaxID=89951 RepID=A0AA47P1S3_MERPO|nr:Odorant receptor 131-2 [Merluccius polli]
MAYNNSTQYDGAPFSLRKINHKVIVVQILITIFLYLNCLLLTTFFKKEIFRRSMRYIFFAYTLMSDCLYLLVTNVMLILSFFQIFMHIWLCLLLLLVLSVYTFVFPITLTAMTLERYVAICMPMQHGALCTPRSALHCILIINAISSLPISISLSTYFASVPLSSYTQVGVCSIEILIIHRWLRSTVTQLYFVIMLVIIVFCYVQIMRAARKASGETKTSTGKGLRTLYFVIMFVIIVFCYIEITKAARKASGETKTSTGKGLRTCLAPAVLITDIGLGKRPDDAPRSFSRQ